MRDVSRGKKSPGFFPRKQVLRKTTGLFVSVLTLDPSMQLTNVIAWHTGSAIAMLQRNGGAPNTEKLLFGHSAVCCRDRVKDCKKKIASGKGHVPYHCVI